MVIAITTAVIVTNTVRGERCSPRDTANPTRQQSMAKSSISEDHGTILPLSILAIFALMSVVALSVAETTPTGQVQRLEVSSLSEPI
jgi:hypothetical protein